ncbi:phosphonate metabolism protein PhnP, partial [Pseudomonas aeruginosa]|nr:phosphonate metabolism protein PhnP [Pseudomonas aeruginosa]
MKLRFLGTGDSAQVPVYNCECSACVRATHDSSWRRRPCSAVIECGDQRWLIDSGRMDLTELFPPGSLNGIL